MTTNLSERHGASIHSRFIPTEPFLSSGGSSSASGVNFPELSLQGLAQLGLDPSSSILPTENNTPAFSFDNWVSELLPNAYPYGYRSRRSPNQSSFSHPLCYPTKSTSVDQLIAESTLPMPPQNAFCQPFASSEYPDSFGANVNEWSDLSITYRPPPENNQASARPTPSLAESQGHFPSVHDLEPYIKSRTETKNDTQPNRRNRASATTRRGKRRTPPRPSPRAGSARQRPEDPCLLRKKGSQTNPPTGARTDSLEDIISDLPPKEQYVVRERLKGTTWEKIREGYKRKDLKSSSTLANVLDGLRRKNVVIAQILPSRQRPSSKASKSSRNARGAVEIMGRINRLQ
ncbi:hypothetical protein FANTH_9389 [Fusarium anthophilum]|uniref:Uncharacterized protein n=1 Tax=Fusarium anthophilum TaxID=48485 RepID=A0A8H4Z5X8_9HYPO|nr:hypothetical protein FANTH_9389 [Fusarium anthophilum]